MQVEYIWRTYYGYENTNTFDNLKDCKKDCKNVLQNITNQGGLPNPLYNQVVKHAKLKTVKDIDNKNINTKYFKVESGTHDGMFFYGAYNYQRNELTSDMEYE